MLGRELRLPMDVVTGRIPREEMLAENTEYTIVMQRQLEVQHQERDHLKFADYAASLCLERCASWEIV